MEKGWIGKLVKFRSGRIGIVISIQVIDRNTFLTVHIPDMGIINIKADDVEEIK